MQKTVSIITLGCKVNQYESECIFNELTKQKYTCFFDLQNTDYYIVNTCAVTNEAEHKSRKVLSSILKTNNNAKIYVIGCSSAINPQVFMGKDNVYAVFGTENKLDVVDAIKKEKRGSFVVSPSNQYVNSQAKTIRTRSTIKIQDGCNNFCTYCIIPYTRGRERSRSIEDITAEINEHYKETKEIVLVGINVAAYGKDLVPQRTLVDVIKLFALYPDVRFRFSSLEMGSITKDTLKELEKHDNFCPFFHLSLQSASDDVLKKMNRKYNFYEYKRTVDLIKNVFPYAMISTDIIVGFPTETENNFIEGINNIKSINFGNIHIFPYSKRDGTVASKYRIIDGNIVKNRVNELNKIAVEMKGVFIEQNQGRIEDVLIEKNYNGYSYGFTKNYIKCYIPCLKMEKNKVYKVKLLTPIFDGIKGELIDG